MASTPVFFFAFFRFRGFALSAAASFERKSSPALTPPVASSAALAPPRSGDLFSPRSGLARSSPPPLRGASALRAPPTFVPLPGFAPPTFAAPPLVLAAARAAAGCGGDVDF